MALFYNPVLTKRPKPKTMSKTAMKKALRDLRKLAKEIQPTDPKLADGITQTIHYLSKLEK